MFKIWRTQAEAQTVLHHTQPNLFVTIFIREMRNIDYLAAVYCYTYNNNKGTMIAKVTFLL